MPSLSKLLFSTTLLCGALPSLVHAAPQDGVVAAGSAVISTNGNATLIQQGSDRAAIDWRSFDVKAHESVVFQQPSSSSITLNRIHDQKPSEIFGSISANGQVILSNPNGMIFGTGSKVDVAGLVATTASISTSSFIKDAFLGFSEPGRNDAKIINHGTITAREAGLVALVGPQVENHGLIGARLGKVQLAGADTFTLDFYGDGLVNVSVDNDTVRTAVTNTGMIRAKAGSVVLTAAQADQIVSSTINSSGIIDVSASRTDSNGTIIFADGIGGDVTLTADLITLHSDTRLYASGPYGGGTVHIGGGFQGKGELPWAETLTMMPGARIAANATDHGDGGEIVLWSNDATRFDGTINARGGLNGGNGGLIETSSKGALGVTGITNASASKGFAGDWLLDPRNVTISGAGAYSINPAGESVDPGADNFTILDSSISAALSNGNNVTITTGTTGAQTGNITLNGATITKLGGGDATLTLKAEGSITTNGTNSITSNTSRLHTVLWSDSEAGTDGYVTLTSTNLATNGGDIVIGGGADNGSNGGTAADGRPDGFSYGAPGSGNGILINNSSLDAGQGNVLVRGITHATAAGYGVFVANATVAAKGSIFIEGQSRSTASYSHGVTFSTNGAIQGENGNIDIRGYANPTGDNSTGLLLYDGGSILSNGTGTINIKATRGSTGVRGGIELQVGSPVIGGSQATGDITIESDSILAGVTGNIRSTGSITFKPLTEPTTIGVSGGTCGGACTLQLTDSILGMLHPDSDGDGNGSLVIGDNSDAAGTVDIAGWDFSNQTYDVDIHGGSVDLTSGAMVWNRDNNVSLHSRTGNLVVDQNFTRNVGTAGDGTLTLRAAGNISSSGTRTISAATSGATGKLHTVLWSDGETTPNSNGAISFGSPVAITSNNGDIIFGGGLDNGSNGGVANDGRPDGYAIGVNTHGIALSSSADISSANGHILMRGNTTGAAVSFGVMLLSNSKIRSSGGNIDIIARSDSSAASAHAMALNSTGLGQTSIISDTGNIRVDADYTGASNSVGIVFWNDAKIATTGSGNVDIYAHSNTSNGIFAHPGGAVPASYLGEALMTGDIRLHVDNINNWMSNMPVQTQGTVQFSPYTAGTAVNVAGAGGLLLYSAVLDGISAGNIQIGDTTSGLVTVNPYASWSSRASNGLSFLSNIGVTFAAGAHNLGSRFLTATTAGPLTVNGALTVGSTLLRSTGAAADFTLGNGGSITSSAAGDAITVVAGRHFINNAGASALAANNSGRWLVYSTTPSSNNTNGILADFSRYGCEFGNCNGFMPGLDGFLYREVAGGGAPGIGFESPTTIVPDFSIPPTKDQLQPSIPGVPIFLGDDLAMQMIIRAQDIVSQVQVENIAEGKFGSYNAYDSSNGTFFDLTASGENLEKESDSNEIEAKSNQENTEKFALEEGSIYQISKALQEILKQTYILLK